jgi:hypothetical protein
MMIITDAAANGSTIQGILIDSSRTNHCTTVAGGEDNPAGGISPAV